MHTEVFGPSASGSVYIDLYSGMTKRSAEMAFLDDDLEVTTEPAHLTTQNPIAVEDDQGNTAELGEPGIAVEDDRCQTAELDEPECDWFITASDDEAMEMTPSTSPGDFMSRAPPTPPSPISPEILDPYYGHDPESVALDALTLSDALALPDSAADDTAVTVEVPVADEDDGSYPQGPVGEDLVPVYFINELTGDLDAEYRPANESSTTSTGIPAMSYEEWEAALLAETALHPPSPEMQ